MQDHSFQATVVGQTTIPEGQGGHHISSYSFLDDMLQKLEKGQAIRLVLPKEKSPSTPVGRWYRICSKGKGHFRKQKQEDGSLILWLWCDN